MIRELCFETVGVWWKACLLNALSGPMDLSCWCHFWPWENCLHQRSSSSRNVCKFEGTNWPRNLVGEGNLRKLLPPVLGHGCYLQSEIAELIALAMKDREVA